jgi:hypothetical protein
LPDSLSHATHSPSHLQVREVIGEEVSTLDAENKRHIRERTATQKRLNAITAGRKYSRFDAEVREMGGLAAH